MLYEDKSRVQLLLAWGKEACSLLQGMLHWSTPCEQHNDPCPLDAMWAPKSKEKGLLSLIGKEQDFLWLQLMFPEIEQDLSKWFSLGSQEKLSVAEAPFSDDSDPHSWALAHPSWVWLLPSYRAQLSVSLFVKAHCLPAYLIFWEGRASVLPLMSFVLSSSFDFEID